MLKAFYKIDLFGKAVLFNYKGHSKSKSKVGAICTVLLFAFVIWITVYFGRQLVDTKNPQATTFESFNDNPAATPLTIDNFAFGIGMSDPVTYANYINESIYTISATTYKTIRVPKSDGSVDIIYEIVPLEMETCRPDHFGELSEKFAYSELDGLYCFKKEQPNLNNSQPTLEGTWESPVFQGIFIDLLQCDRNASNNKCGTQAEIDALLGAGLLTLTFTNVAVDVTDRQKPVKKFRDGWYTSTGNKFNKEINLYLEQLEINTDEGWLTSDFQTDNYIKYGEIREMFSLTQQSNYVHFVVRLSNVKQHFNRSYTKIQDVIAQVNGTIAVTFTILFILLAPYVRLKFYEALINEIFDIKTAKRNSKDRKAKHKPKQAQPNSKSKDQNKALRPFPDKLTIPSHIDLEQLRVPSTLNNDPLSPRIELTDRKDTDEVNLFGRVPSVEGSSARYNFAGLIQSPLLSINKRNIDLKDTRNSEVKLEIGSHSRGLSELPLNFSGSQIENKLETHSELIISRPSPKSPKQFQREMSLLSRKPTFLQPNFKILDYEDHGQDLFEDILKNFYPVKKREDNDVADELAISEIRSEENDEEDDFSHTDEKISARKDQKEVGLSPDKIQGNNEKVEQQKQKQKEPDRNPPHAKYKLQRLDVITTKNMDEIELSFWEYIRSFFSKSDVIKLKMSILNEGIKRINERLDIFNLFKKLREFDKLKVLLLESEQFVLFDSLPKPELSLKQKDAAPKATALSQSKIKDPQFIQEKIKKDLILLSYENLKRKPMATMLDKKLFEIYDDILYLKS